MSHCQDKGTGQHVERIIPIQIERDSNEPKPVRFPSPAPVPLPPPSSPVPPKSNSPVPLPAPPTAPVPLPAPPTLPVPLPVPSSPLPLPPPASSPTPMGNSSGRSGVSRNIPINFGQPTAESNVNTVGVTNGNANKLSYLEVLSGVEAKVKDFEERAKGTQSKKELQILDELLTQELIGLDNLEVDGIDGRKKRKEMVEMINRVIKVVEGRVELEEESEGKEGGGSN